MDRKGELLIDPGSIDVEGGAEELEVVVIHREFSVTAAVLQRAGKLVAGLNARILLLAVHTVPFPASYASASVSHAHLAGQLVDLAEGCAVPAMAQVVLARDLGEGIRHVLKPESTVLVGARRRIWKSAEERLARMLAHEGHKVVLLYVDRCSQSFFRRPGRRSQ
jgi:hypothetical protein